MNQLEELKSIEVLIFCNRGVKHGQDMTTGRV
jgi:hypothetical protein